MIDLSFNNGTVEQFSLILTSRDQRKLGQLSNVKNIKYSAKLNGADELSFEVCKFLDDHEEVLWDDIYDLRLVWIKELDQYFEIRVDLIDKFYMTKTITCTSLCECELSQTGLYDIEINTADDIARPDYDVNYPTVFYRILPAPTSPDYKKRKTSSLLHRILEKVPAYTIKHVDSSLMDLQRTFSISNTTVYDFLTKDCSEQFNCLFKFDSKDRSISVYDLYTVCNSCGERGDFRDACPNCGSTSLKYFGEDTTVFVSTENLTDEVRFETDTDSIKNAFRLEAGDDNMTAAIINSNPTGSRYIYEFSDEARKDMPEELVSKMNAYDEKYNEYNNTFAIPMNGDSTLPSRHPYRNREERFYHIVAKLPSPIYITFNSQSYIESGYDTLSFYIKENENSYKYYTISGSIGGKTYRLPSNEFWLRWYSDGSQSSDPPHNYWGWEIDSIRSTASSYQTVTEQIASVLPSSTWEEYIYRVYSTPILNEVNGVINKYNQWTCQECGTRWSETHNTCPNCSSYLISKRDPQWATIPQVIYGYKNLIPYYYECVDIYSYLKSSMMPEVIIPEVTVTGEAGNIQSAFRTNFKLALSRLPTNNTAVQTVNSAALNYAKAVAKTGFVKVIIDPDSTNSYDKTNHLWTGTFKVINTSDDSDYAFTESLSVQVTDEYSKFIEEKIAKQLLSKCDIEVYDVLKLIAEAPLNSQYITDFKNVIRLYSANRLQSFHDAIEAVIGVLIDAGQGNAGTSVTSKSQLYDSFYTPYYTMLGDCEAELNTRNHEIELIWGSYDMNGLMVANGMIQYLVDRIKFIHDELNFEKFIGEDLYKTFTTYIREQTYTNSNYISDGLDNDQLFANASQFLDRAKEELHKSATYQHSIKTNLNNLLAIDKFKPLLDKFELGNWIRVKADENIYRLRLIAYSIDFDNIQTINTEFSDVTITANGLNDIQSIIKQAASMASSYGYTEKQAETGSQVKYNYIDEWVQNGLNSALVRINNNNEEDIQIDETGITARTYDDISDSYDDEQVRITHNVIAFTDDNWESVKTALGKFEMTHYPIEADSYGGININTIQIRSDEYGLVANAVLAGWIVGSNMQSSTIIGSHFQAPGNASYIDMTPSTATGRNYFIKLNKNGVDKFTVDKDGNMDARSGNISGAHISGSSITLSGSIDENEDGYVLVKNGSDDVVKIDRKGIRMYSGRIEDATGNNYWDLYSGDMRMIATTKVNDTNAKHKKSYVPSNNNEPASLWTDDTTKASHIGETFYCTSNGKTYVYNIISSSSSIPPTPSSELPSRPISGDNPYGDNERYYYHFVMSSGSLTENTYLKFISGSNIEAQNRDYFTIYKRNGSTYSYGTINTQSIGDVYYNLGVVDEFWMFWQTDGSWNADHGYYWGIESITNTFEYQSSTISFSSSTSSLPSNTWTEVPYSTGGGGGGGGVAVYGWEEATINNYPTKDMNQDQIFYRLTNGGENQGLVIKDGKLYINAEYIQTGTLKIGGTNYSTGPKIEVRDRSNTLIGEWNEGGLKVYKGTIEGLTIKAGTITGTSISAGTISGAEISGGTISGAEIDGGKITGATIQSKYSGLNNSTYMLTEEGMYGYQNYDDLVGWLDWRGGANNHRCLGIGGEGLNIYTDHFYIDAYEGVNESVTVFGSSREYQFKFHKGICYEINIS